MIKFDFHPGKIFSIYEVVGVFEIHNKELGWILLPIGTRLVLDVEYAQEGILKERLKCVEEEVLLLPNTPEMSKVVVQ